MQTQLATATQAAIQQAATLLKNGEVVAIPTETVYGLAANALNDEAVKKIFLAKGRPQDNPLIAHISNMDMLPQVAQNIPETAIKLARAFWPGPLTLILPCAKGVAPSVSAGLGTVGVRMPRHKVALAVIGQAGVPLAAPSANLSGSPSPTTAAHVWDDMQGRIPLILDGGPSEVGLESTVLSLAKEPTVLRPGYITAAQIERVIGRPVRIDASATQPLQQGAKAASPGMKYRHYAPKAQVIVVEGPFEAFQEYVAQKAAPGVWALCFTGEENHLQVPAIAYGSREKIETQASALFAALRRLDEEGAQVVYARGPSRQGVGLAVYNRLLRAAAFRVVQL